MPAAVVDTSVLVDFRDESSPRHDRAQEIVRAIDRGDLPTTRVTNYVLLETLNWLQARRRHDLAVDTYHRLVESAGFAVSHAAQKDFAAAVDCFETHDSLAFGDATIVAYMRREGIEYLYSFDADFDAVDGVTRLATADNPFR